MRGLAALVLAALVGGSALGCSGGEQRKAEHLARGDALRDAGELDKARLEYKNALRIDPNDAGSRFKLATVLERSARWHEAASQYARVVELEPEHPEARVRLARLLFSADAAERAEEHLAAALEREPENAGALMLRAAVRWRDGDQSGAVGDARRAAARAPERADAIGLLAALLAQAGETEEAEREVRRGLERHPGNLPLRELLVRILRGKDDREGAIATLEQILARDPARLEARRQIAELRVAGGDPAAARAALDAAVARDPEDTDAKLALLDLLARHVGKEAAVKAAGDFLRARPGEARLWFALARIHTLAGDREPAKDAYRAAIERFGTSPDGLRARNLLAGILAKEKDLAAAQALVTAILNENPLDADALLLNAGLALVKNHPETAIVSLRTLLRDHPGNQTARKILARAHVLNNEWDQGQEVLQAALQNDPQDLDAHFMLVRLLDQRAGARATAPLRARTLAAARGLAGERIARNPADLDAVLARGRAALLSGDPKAARRDLERVLAARPGSVEARRLLARALVAAGDPEGAIASLRARLSGSPADGTAALELARLLLEAGEPEEALGVVAAGLAGDAPDVELLRVRAEALRRLGRWPEMAAVARQIQDAAAEQPVGFYLEGLALQARGAIEESVALFRAALARSPNAVEPLVALARSYFARQQPAAALELLDRALAAAPSDVAALNLRGEVLLAAGRHAEAEAAFRRAMSIRPQWALPYENLGRTRLALGDTSAALEALARAAEVDPDNLSASYQLAAIYERVGNHEAAAAQYEAILARHAGEVVAANNLAMLLVRDELRSPQSLERALALTRRFGEAQQPELRDTRAWVLLHAGANGEALALLSEVVHERPEDPTFRYHLARALLAKGDREKAERLLAQLVDSPLPAEERRDAEARLERLLDGQGRDFAGERPRL